MIETQLWLDFSNLKNEEKKTLALGVRYLGIAESIHKYNTFCTYFEAKLDLANNIYVWIPTYI